MERIIGKSKNGREKVYEMLKRDFAIYEETKETLQSIPIAKVSIELLDEDLQEILTTIGEHSDGVLTKVILTSGSFLLKVPGLKKNLPAFALEKLTPLALESVNNQFQKTSDTYSVAAWRMKDETK